MRPTRITLAVLLAAATAAWAKLPPNSPIGPVPPAVPAQPPAVPLAQANAKLNEHIQAWEKKMQGLTNFRSNFEMTSKDSIFQKQQTYSGVVLCMKPNFGIVRRDNQADNRDYEAYLCNGKSIFAYNGLQKRITEYPIPANEAAGAAEFPIFRIFPALAGESSNLMLDFLGGITADEAQKRFDISLHQEDESYIYFEIRPILPKDKMQFDLIRLALFGPNTKHAYLPAQILLQYQNGDTITWKFKEPQFNLPGVNKSNFEFKNVEGLTFTPAGTPGTPLRTTP